jgi:hypothetical protein
VLANQNSNSTWKIWPTCTATPPISPQWKLVCVGVGGWLGERVEDWRPWAPPQHRRRAGGQTMSLNILSCLCRQISGWSTLDPSTLNTRNFGPFIKKFRGFPAHAWKISRPGCFRVGCRGGD